MRTLFLIAMRIISGALGFVFAVSYVRGMSSAYSFYVRHTVGNMLHFGVEVSLVALVVCVIMFIVSICLCRSKHVYPLRRLDYAFLLIFCSAGFAACVQAVTSTTRHWWAPSLFVLVIVVPFVAYCLALMAIGELTARIRDRTLVRTLYWVQFFRVYSAWRAVGFMALILLAVLTLTLVMYVSVPFIFVTTLTALGISTYFAAHMINLAAEYDIAAADKIRSERFKSELITNVSHDIKTPLTSIINYVDLLRAQQLEGQAANYVEVLTRKSTRLKVLIDDLMDASKASTGNIRLDMRQVNLVELVGQAAGEFEDAFDACDLTLVIRGASQAYAFADSRYLYRALENLFANASKYSLAGTRVFAEISELASTGHVLFTLQNTSEHPIDLDSGDLTEQFIRGDKARQTEGSGLGLYIAKSLIELMGGSLRIHIMGDLFRVEVALVTNNITTIPQNAQHPAPGNLPAHSASV